MNAVLAPTALIHFLKTEKRPIRVYKWIVSQ